MKLYLSILVALLCTASVGASPSTTRRDHHGKDTQPPSAGNRISLHVLAVANKV